MLEVGAVLVRVPAELRERLGPQLAGVVGEADDGQVVARVLGPDQRVERDRDALGGEVAPPEQHRAAHVHEQDGRGRRRPLRPEDLEVVGVQPDGLPGRPPRRRVLLAHQRVRHRRPQVELERVAELERLGGLLAVAAAAGPLQAVAAERVAPQPGEQVVEHLLADPPAAARRQLHAVAVAIEVAGGLERVARSSSASRSRAASGPRRSRTSERSISPMSPGPVDAFEVALEAVQRLELAELVQRRFEAQRLVSAEAHPVPQPVGEQLVEVRRELGEVPPAAGRRGAARRSCPGAPPAARATATAAATASPPSARRAARRRRRGSPRPGRSHRAGRGNRRPRRGWVPPPRAASTAAGSGPGPSRAGLPGPRASCPSPRPRAPCSSGRACCRATGRRGRRTARGPRRP